MAGGAEHDVDRLVSIRDVLLEILAADKYPCLGNEDVKVTERLEAEALAKADRAVAAPEDPPEFAR